jgi:hypothetical protein
MQIINTSKHLLITGEYKTGQCVHTNSLFTDTSNLLTPTDVGKMISVKIGAAAPIFNMIESISASGIFTLKYNVKWFESAEYVVLTPIEDIFLSYPQYIDIISDRKSVV